MAGTVAAYNTLRFTPAVVQFSFFNLARLAIENIDLLPTRVEITSYNVHGGFSGPGISWSSTKEKYRVG